MVNDAAMMTTTRPHTSRHHSRNFVTTRVSQLTDRKQPTKPQQHWTGMDRDIFVNAVEDDDDDAGRDAQQPRV